MAKRTVPNGSKSNAPSIQAKIRAAKAVALRLEGKTFPEIARELKYNSQQAAYDAVMRTLKATQREPSDELRKLELERLDVMWPIHFLNAQAGDVQALAACMKVMERRALLLGLNAPVKVDSKTEVTSKEGVLVIGPVMSEGDWEAAAKQQQSELTQDD